MPETIDERVLNKGKLNPFTVTENQNVVINSAKVESVLNGYKIVYLKNKRLSAAASSTLALLI